ncbi:cysteinyl-tRNA synthetase [Methylobacterium indicum]|uniref:cysteine--tRNA ligase n=1 Tax=Methylobacterium indicum TaxID=1775910 RepID=UPI000733F442|nr:cysteine--tRNA ligase [Methylobacterium indicum]KTS25660.1 cysteinyl-tRNA synthetase [Methylobacterium indicum]KTS30442.1 cysteinyl-tRNA synthetase [Methylobacterium indicum]KTS43249.1 cysteinyl-tRNA synthetase [Methylobacterium indicum]
MASLLRLYNTLSRAKEPLRPIDSGRVRMYACGPTVYDAAHIGNARPLIVFDLLFRLLRHLYGAETVTYARNVTDVDDKINARAAERGITIRELTDGTLAQFHDDIRRLGILLPDDVNVPGRPPAMIEPRATDHIVEMTTLIDRLVTAGHAYVAEDHVLFDVPSMPDYGALSRRPLDEMEAGARVDVAPYKRSPLDFVLWKPSKPGEPSWPSPGGIAVPGRPGWHIECSAMAWKHLGETFDIHAGGIDLVFPHHENEVAQTRCCFGTPVMANIWLHNGFLQVEGEKMSKSLGNFVTLREVLADWPGEVVRLAMLRTHYRQPIDWTLRGLEEASRTLDRWYEAAGDAEPGPAPESVLEPLLDDLNTPAALGEVHRLADPASLKAGAGLLGLLGQTKSARAQAAVAASGVDAAEVERLIAERKEARTRKDWAESDRIRGALTALGVTVKDNKDGTTSWTVNP